MVTYTKIEAIAARGLKPVDHNGISILIDLIFRVIGSFPRHSLW